MSPEVPTDILGPDDFRRLVERSRSTLGAAGITASFGRAPRIGGAPGSTWVSMVSPIGHGRLVRSRDGSSTVTAYGLPKSSPLLDERHPQTTVTQLNALVTTLGGERLTGASGHARAAPPTAPAAAAAIAAAAGVLSILASRAWYLAPAALATATAAAHLLRVRWSTVLTAAVAFLGAAAAAPLVGWASGSDGLAVIAFGLATLGCATALASRMRTGTRAALERIQALTRGSPPPRP